MSDDFVTTVYDDDGEFTTTTVNDFQHPAAMLGNVVEGYSNPSPYAHAGINLVRSMFSVNRRFANVDEFQDTLFNIIYPDQSPLAGEELSLLRSAVRLQYLTADGTNHYWSSAFALQGDVYDQVLSHIERVIGDYEDPLAAIYAIELLQQMEGVPGTGAKGRRTNAQVHAKWLRVFSLSHENCFFIALGVAMEWRDNYCLLVNEAKRRQFGQTVKKEMRLGKDTIYATEVEYQNACDIYKVNLILYNNLYKEIHRFACATTPSDTLHIMVSEGHAEALIDRKELQAVYGDKLETPAENTIVKCVGHVKNKNNKNKNIRYGYDEILECEDGSVILKGERFEDMMTFRAHVINHNIDCTIYEDAKPEPIDMSKFQEKVFEVNDRIGSLDLETCVAEDSNDGAQYAYGFGVDLVLPSGKFCYKNFWGFKTCIKEGMEYLYTHRTMFDKRIIYMHNGSRFDAYFLLNEYLFYNKNLWVIDTMLENEGAVIILKIKSVEKDKINPCVITFHDSFKLTVTSLDNLCKDLKTNTQKLVDTVDHSKINSSNYMSFIPILEPYLKNDCRCLNEAMIKYINAVYEDDGLDLTRYCTASAYAVKSFFYKYYQQEEFPIYKLSKEQDQFCRASYFGGNTQAFTLGHVGKCWYWDRVSLYPDVGRNDIPYGPGEWLSPEEFLDDNGNLKHGFHGFVEVFITSTNCNVDDNEVPLFCVKEVVNKSRRLLFPKISYCGKPMVVTTAEIRYAMENKLHYKYKYVRMLRFAIAPIMKKFFNENFSKRLEAKTKGQSALAMIRKLKMNSTYGKFGQRMDRKDSLTLYPTKNPPFLREFYDNRLVSVSRKGHYSMVRARCDFESKENNVAVSSFITAYARIEMHKMITAVRKVGGWVHYCDTDSIITNIDIALYPELFKFLVPDGVGKNLGSAKNEFPDKLKGEFSGNGCYAQYPKHVQDAIWKEGEQNCMAFDRGIIAMAKVYFLQKDFKCVDNLPPFTVSAFKGLSKKMCSVTIDDYERMLNGERFMPFGDDEPLFGYAEEEYTVEEEGEMRAKKRKVTIVPKGQAQFVGGKAALLTETYEDASLKVLYRKKKFTMVYSKGHWTPKELTQKVRPFTIAIGNTTEVVSK